MASKDRAKKNVGVDLLEFLGDEEAPEPLEKVLQRRWTQPEGDEPDDLVHARTHRTVWVPPGVRGGKGKVTTDQRDDLDDLGYVSASYAVDSPDAMHLPGRVAERRKPEELIGDVDPQVGVGAHRPSWMPSTFYPRPLSGLDRAPRMRRINGRAVDPLYVFGPDDRQSYMDSSWPWGLVGKIFNSNGQVGTGALIGPRLVATAGHMVPWDSEGWWMRFVPAFYNGASLHGAGVESYVSDARGYDTPDVTGYDWAVTRLYEPLGDWLGYFGYNGFSNSWEDDPYWTLLGYPGAVAGGQRPSYQPAVSVFDIDSDSNGGKELETKADMTPGNSGGPLFGWWNGDPRLVGVVSGQEEDWSPGFWPWDWADTEKGNVVAGGSGFTNLMAWGRTNWT